MYIQEAIASGKPFKRPSFEHFYIELEHISFTDEDGFSFFNPYLSRLEKNGRGLAELDLEDILANDWIVKQDAA